MFHETICIRKNKVSRWSKCLWFLLLYYSPPLVLRSLKQKEFLTPGWNTNIPKNTDIWINCWNLTSLGRRRADLKVQVEISFKTIFNLAKMDGRQATAIVFQCHQENIFLKTVTTVLSWKIIVFGPKKAILRASFMVKASFDQQVLKLDGWYFYDLFSSNLSWCRYFKKCVENNLGVKINICNSRK